MASGRVSDSTKAMRRILGVLSLAKKHGPAVVDEAAKAALEIGVPTYRFLRRYLERQPAAPLSLKQVDPLIRQIQLTLLHEIGHHFGFTDADMHAWEAEFEALEL